MPFALYIKISEEFIELWCIFVALNEYWQFQNQSFHCNDQILQKGVVWNVLYIWVLHYWGFWVLATCQFLRICRQGAREGARVGFFSGNLDLQTTLEDWLPRREADLPTSQPANMSISSSSTYQTTSQLANMSNSSSSTTNQPTNWYGNIFIINHRSLSSNDRSSGTVGGWKRPPHHWVTLT